MSQEFVIGLARETLALTLLLSAPVLLVSVVVGVLVSVFQAATQIQEQTLSFVPKIVAIMLTLLLLGSWMLNTVLSYTSYLFASLSSLNH